MKLQPWRATQAFRNWVESTKDVAATQLCGCCGHHIPKRQSFGSYQDDPLVPDHNHRTNHYRGWICRSCNTVIGYVAWPRNNPQRYAEVMAYLKRTDPTYADKEPTPEADD